MILVMIHHWVISKACSNAMVPKKLVCYYISKSQQWSWDFQFTSSMAWHLFFTLGSLDFPSRELTTIQNIEYRDPPWKEGTESQAMLHFLMARSNRTSLLCSLCCLCT